MKSLNIHIYGKNFFYNDGNKTYILDKNQFSLLNNYIKTKNLIKTVNYFFDKLSIKNENYYSTYKNIETAIYKLEKKLSLNLKKVHNIKITGVYGMFYPRVLNIELCDYCNFYCGHCYKNANKVNKNFLDINIIYKIAELYKNKIQTIHLTGGEPLSHPSINEVLDILLNSGFIVNITTNGSMGSLLDYNIIEKVNTFQVSLYGYNSKTYKIVTGIDNFAEVTKFLSILETKKLSYNIGFMINRTYLDYYEEYNDFLNSLNFDKIIFSFARLAGRLRENNLLWILNKDERDFIRKCLLPNIKGYNSLESNKIESKKIRCSAGTLSYNLDEMGNLGLCQVLSPRKYILGDIYSIDDRAKFNNFDILNEINNNRLNDSLNPMCKYY